MRNYSAKFRETVRSTSAAEAPVILVEISHPDLAEPARVVEDNDDFPYGAAYAFVPGAAYALNQIAVPAEYNSRYYKCTVAGTAGGAEPIWPDVLNDTVVSGSATFRCEGNQFKAVAFRGKLPDDQDQQLPRAQLAIDNIGRELMQWVESSNGGRGAQARIMQMLRSDPATIEWEITMDLTNLRANMAEVTGNLSFENLLEQAAVPLGYRPDTAPDLF